ncbi:MAG TPA: PLDc N-terminal domain-containing protein [Streptosporangiaceae bacterium]|nr:PLDc N-terminal domain-containing protein [Streptosporangiaceae bacterium]
MLLPGALFVLFIAGFWFYCLIDVALTPSNECPRLPKAAWLVIVAVTFVIGAVLWLAVRPPGESQPRPA